MRIRARNGGRHPARGRVLALAFLAALLGGLLLLAAPPARADGDPATDVVRAVDVAITVAADGTLHVQETYQWDFGTRNGLGFYRDLVHAMGWAPDPEKVRLYEYANFHLSSPSGAPAGVWVESDDGTTMRLAAGAPDGSSDTRTGLQVYVLSYDVAGALNAVRQEGLSQDELYWNIFTDIANPFGVLRVTVTGPADVVDQACYRGPFRSAAPCDQHEASGPTASFTATGLEVGDGMSVMAAWPAGTFGDIEPILVDRSEWQQQNSGALGPVVRVLDGAGGAIAGHWPLAVGGWLGVLALIVWRRVDGGRDRYWMGLPPGLTPAEGTTANVGRLRREPPVTVQFTPPAGLTPAEGGALTDESTSNDLFAATIVDLAVRGHLTIEDTGTSLLGKPDDWRLRRRPGPAGERLRAYEHELLADLFATGSSVEVSELRGTFAPSLRDFHRGLTRHADAQRWFTRPGLVRGAVRLGGPLQIAVLAATAATFLLGAGSILVMPLALGAVRPVIAVGALAVALVSLTAAFVATAKAAHARTADGRAVYEQVRGFRQYLTTADARQLRWEEGEDIFSRYLPWAMVFDVADRWSRVFEQLAAEGRYSYAGTWYVGPHGGGPGAVSFQGIGRSVGSLASTGMRALATTPGSSGGSGGGGFSGGGGGGGGAGGR